MKNIILLILITVTFLSSSCVVSFENSLTDSQTIPFDNRLIGKWLEIKEKEAVFKFSTNSDSKIIVSMLDENGDPKLLFTAFTVKIGKYNYLSLKLIDEDIEKTSLLVRYDLQGDEMTTWLPDKVKFNEFISQGKLSGKTKSYGEISVSNTPDELKKILESNENDELFEFFCQLKKQ